ncbi:efflux RND transporter permease subunit VmeI [Desulfobaculum senezii]
MSIAEFAIRRRTVTLALCAVILLGGLYAYEKLGRLEDPEFTIKDAVVITAYPGASAREVAEEVSDEIETAVQQLAQLKEIKSISRPGLSIVTARVKDKFGKSEIPQVWDELRRRVLDAQPKLPPGASTPQVNDNFGDVFGILLTVSGEGYTYEELRRYVQFLRRELLLVDNVAKVELWGLQEEAIFIEFSRFKLARMGVSPDVFVQALATQNLVSPAGSVPVGPERVRISPTGELLSVEDIASLEVRDPASNRLVALKDVATVSRGYVDPPDHVLHFDGKPALSIGISVAPGGNVVKLGDAVKARMTQLEQYRPVGMEIGVVNFQPDDVRKAVDGFVVNFIEALAIVVVVLLVFMGLKSGVLIGVVLALTVLATMIAMDMMSITLQRISLGALIIALGMLVDNAIVVTEGMLVRIESGVDRIKAANEVVGQNMMPLLGATVIAILAFAAIGGSSDGTGEYCRSLFQVMLLSLFISWVLAITVTPLLCTMAFRPRPGGGDGSDAYSGRLFTVYRRFLEAALARRWQTVIVLVVLLVGAVLWFGTLKNSFFPPSTRPQFQIHYWLPEGTDITRTVADISVIEEKLLADERVTSTASYIGKGATRFMLVFGPEQSQSKAYGLILVRVHDYNDIDGLIDEYGAYLAERFPDAEPKLDKFVLGPGGGYDVEARFYGPDPAELRTLANKAKDVFRTSAKATAIRDNWRQKSMVLRPRFNETMARQNGLTRQDVLETLESAFTGSRIGVYREGDDLLPIIARSNQELRDDVAHISELYVWSSLTQTMVPITQAVTGFDVLWEDTLIRRENRKLVITAQCDAVPGALASEVFQEVRAGVEAIDLPFGYTMEWGGEYESSRDAQESLAGLIPITIIAMVLIVIMLFNALRQTVIIWLTVPLAIIGVTFGLAVFDLPFDFMAILGFLSLIGMLIKNAIVLIDQIDFERRGGKADYQAIVDSGVSRLRPVCMAAITTVLGMLPLLQDPFFISMAVTIMFGLSFATVLTLVVVPVLYALFFGVRGPEAAVSGTD